MTAKNSRRAWIRTVGGSVTAGTTALSMGAQVDPSAPTKQSGLLQSVCKWCFRSLSVEELARGAAAIGIKSVELLPPDDWPILKKFSLTCAVASHADARRNPQIRAGLNRKENHDAWESYFKQFIDASAEAGVPNVICFSGWREGMSDEEGLENCAIGLRRVIGQAEKRGVTLCMELLNSKIEGRPGEYMCDHTAWGVKLVKRVASPRFKLLYDIYHMQIMEGDIIRTITDNWEYIAHYHSAGNPGRHEIEGSQELNYPAICKALLAKNYKGYLAQEFLPTRDPLASLAQAFQICSV